MKKILGLLRPFTGILLLSVLFSTANTVMQLLIPYYTKNIMSAILEYDQQKIFQMGMIMLGFTLAGVLLSIANTYFSTKTSVGYSIALRNYIFDKVSHLSQSSIDKIGVSSLITRTTNDVRQLHDIILNTLKSLIPIPVMLVGGLVLAYRTSPEVLKTSLGVVPMLAVLAVVMIVIIVPMYNKVQKLLDRINQVMREKIGGIRVVRAFNRTEYEDGRFNETNKKLTGLSLRAARIMAGIIPVATLFLYGLVCLIMYRLVVQVNGLDPVLDKETIAQTIPNLSAFIAYFSLVITSIASVIGIVTSIPRATISGKRVNAILSAVSDVLPPENPVQPIPADLGKVELRGVGFTYPERPAEDDKKRRKKKKKGEAEEKPEGPLFSLHDISFSCAPGELTAVIGVTGAGKSTMLNLIPRLYDATEGEVLVNGVNVKELSPESLAESIAVVPQQAFLFSGTVAENVRFGNPDATDAEVWRALEIAQAKNFVDSLPDRENSFVSQAGKNFSGGQKQRLAIARAVAKGAKIILFDDSFSALDLATDARLRASLRENLTDTNLIIVAQRVGTVLNADRIIVMENGRTVGVGTHAELLRSCEIYREIVATQLGEDAVKEGSGYEE